MRQASKSADSRLILIHLAGVVLDIITNIIGDIFHFKRDERTSLWALRESFVRCSTGVGTDGPHSGALSICKCERTKKRSLAPPLHKISFEISELRRSALGAWNWPSAKHHFLLGGASNLEPVERWLKTPYWLQTTLQITLWHFAGEKRALFARRPTADSYIVHQIAKSP